ncbi:MAG: tubulin-like doman-containing protein [Firmicutes bacterium]|nr:tubulin-like doman-containing protein [Bacillota bacterium]
MDASQAKVGNLRPIRPTVIIGLGGTGQRIVMEVRRRIIQEYGSLDRIPIVGFLVLDTDSEKPILPGMDEDTLGKIQLAPSEMFHSKVVGTHKLKDELNSYPHLSEWVDRAILERGDATQGAKGIRAIGRLSYFVNFVDIKKAITSMISQVTNQPNLKYMAENHNMQVAPGVNFFIITSICGGTGSGMFLDMAFTIKDMMAGTEHQRIGYLILPGVFGTDIAKASGYAALRELNHYSMDRDFEANWENENQPRIIQPPPFDFCYLVNNSNNKVSFSQKEHLFEMVAHNIFLEFSHEFGQYKASLKDNIQAVATGTDKLGCPLNYISFGLSTISFPRDRIIRACSYRLAKEVVQKWLTTKGPSDRLTEYLDHFMDYNKLFVDTDAAKKNQIKDELLMAGGKNYYSLVDDEMTSLFRGLQNQDANRYDQFIEKKAEELEKKFYEGDQDPRRWGEYFRGIFNNRETKKKAVEDLLVDTVSKMIQSDKEGMEYSKSFLEALEYRLTQYRDYFRGKFDAISKAEGGFAKDKIMEIEKLRALKTKFVFDKKKVMLDQADKLINTRTGKVTIYFKRKLDKKVLEMSILLAGELAEFCKFLLGQIDRFKDKLARIQKSLHDSEKTLTLDTSALDVYSLVLYDTSDVDTYYNEFLTSRDLQRNFDSISLTGKDALNEIGGIPLFELRNDEYPDRIIKDALLKVSRPRFVEIEDISVARKFNEKYPTESEQSMHLRNIFSSSEVFLKFKVIPDYTQPDNSKVSLIGVHEGRQPSLPEFREMLPLLERSCTDVNQLRGIQPIRQKDEILFTTEEGAFPLRRINDIDDYEAKYDKLSSGSQNPLHLRKYDREFLVEINQPAESEQRKAKVGIYIGIAIGIIKPDEDDDSFMVYTYRDQRTGFIENKPIGKRNEEEKMIDNLLHRFNKDLRETIFADIDRRLNAARTPMDKGKIWHNINKYRDDYMKRRDKDFINRRRIPALFEEVILEYKLFDPSFLDDNTGV